MSKVQDMYDDYYADKQSETIGRLMKDHSALGTQVGGKHYTEMGLQPFEITYANFGYSGIRASCYTKVNKYLVRDKDDHKGQLEKAIHVLQVQLEFLNREQDK